MAATLRMHWLGRRLRELRESSKLSLKAVAEEVGRSEAMLSRWETGAFSVSEADLLALLDLYGVGAEDRDGLIRVHRAARSVAWWDAHAEDVAEPLLNLTWFESMATAFRIFSATTLDGLAQTAGYARAVMQADAPNASDTDLARWLELRVMRQAVLARPEPPLYELVLDEAIIRRVVGGPAIMADQLRHLVTLAERPQVVVRVLPFDAGAHASPNGGFRLLDLPAPLSEMAAVGTPGGTLFLEPPRSAALRERYAALALVALTADETADLFAERIHALENQ